MRQDHIVAGGQGGGLDDGGLADTGCTGEQNRNTRAQILAHEFSGLLGP